MDKKSMIGFGLIAAIFLLMGYINRPTEEQLAKQREDAAQKALEQEKQVQEEASQTIEFERKEIQINDSVEEQFFQLENKELILKFSNRGGNLISAQLKNYKTYDQKELILFDPTTSAQSFNFGLKDKIVRTTDLNFVKDKQLSSATKLVLQSPIEEGYIQFSYTINESYKIDFDLKLVNLGTHISRGNSYMEFNWDQLIRGTEKGRVWENRYTELSYKFHKDEVDELSNTSDDEAELKSRIKWVAYKQQFFSTVFVADKYFTRAELKSINLEQKSDKYLKEFKSNISIDFNRENTDLKFSFYILPNQYNILATQSEEAEEELAFTEFIHLGWGIFGWVNQGLVIPVFNFLGGFMSNYGLIILVLTIIIKTIIFPFTYKSYVSQAKMKALKPEIEKINAKIPKEKAMERQQETMKLYKKAGVNPLGGCLPLLFQMPFLYALFMFFPSAMELRGESFLWAQDLSTYDSILTLPFTIPMYGNHVSLFTLLMTITNLIYTKINSANMNTGGEQMAGMKYMMYFMPIFFLLFLNNYASGLTFYYFVSLLITIIQTYAIKATIDDKKILAKLEANKRKPQKKSKFQKALEEAQRKQAQRK